MSLFGSIFGSSSESHSSQTTQEQQAGFSNTGSGQNVSINALGAGSPTINLTDQGALDMAGEIVASNNQLAGTAIQESLKNISDANAIGQQIMGQTIDKTLAVAQQSAQSSTEQVLGDAIKYSALVLMGFFLMKIYAKKGGK
jgi:hypothetical protein